MRALGTVLVLLGGVGLWMQLRREALRPIRVGRAILSDLALLRLEVCTRRRSLPELLETTLDQGLGAETLWRPLGERIRRGRGAGESLPACWAGAVEALPVPLGSILAPMGPLLPAGGERLGAAIDETREELTRFLQTEEERQGQAGRLTAGVCLSGACLLILVLI